MIKRLTAAVQTTVETIARASAELLPPTETATSAVVTKMAVATTISVKSGSAGKE